VAAGVRVQRLEQVVLDEGSPKTVVIAVMELLEHGASDAALRTGTSHATILLTLTLAPFACSGCCSAVLCALLDMLSPCGVFSQANSGAGGGGAHVCLVQSFREHFPAAAATSLCRLLTLFGADALSRAALAACDAAPLALCVALYQCVSSSHPSPSTCDVMRC
jgi:hypothetical protein